MLFSFPFRLSGMTSYSELCLFRHHHVRLCQDLSRCLRKWEKSSDLFDLFFKLPPVCPPSLFSCYSSLQSICFSDSSSIPCCLSRHNGRLLHDCRQESRLSRCTLSTTSLPFHPCIRLCIIFFETLLMCFFLFPRLFSFPWPHLVLCSVVSIWPPVAAVRRRRHKVLLFRHRPRMRSNLSSTALLFLFRVILLSVL